MRINSEELSHFDIKQKAEDEGKLKHNIATPLNTGIAVVVPAHVIEELIMNNHELKEDRENHLKKSDTTYPAVVVDLKN